MEAWAAAVQEEYARNGVDLTLAEAKDEVIAKFCEENLFKDEAGVQRLVNENRSLGQKILDWVRGVKNKLMGTTVEKELARIESMYEKALREGEKKQGEKAQNSIVLGKKADVKIDDAGMKEVIDGYGITNLNDGVGVFRKVYDGLIESGFFKNEGNTLIVNNADTGLNVEIGKRGIEETLSSKNNFERLPYAVKREKIALMEHLPEMIRYGEVVVKDGKEQKDIPKTKKKNSSVKYTYIESPVTINGVKQMAQIDIRRTIQKDLYYLLSIRLKNNNSQPVSQQADESVIPGSNQLTTDKTIAQESGNNNNSAEISQKEKQLSIIKNSNQMDDDYHVGIRTVDDIKTFEEAMQDEESFVYGDFSKEDAEAALKSGKVTVYSSKPIMQGSVCFHIKKSGKRLCRKWKSI